MGYQNPNVKTHKPLIFFVPKNLTCAHTPSSSSIAYPSHITINMPALSPTMTMGNIGTWQKKVGDAVAPGDVLVEIETDKAQMDFECQEEGFIAKILADSGSKEVNINQPIAIMVENKEDIEKFADFTAESAGAAAAPAATEEKKTEAPKAEAAKEAPKAASNANAAASRADAGKENFVSLYSRTKTNMDLDCGAHLETIPRRQARRVLYAWISGLTYALVVLIIDRIFASPIAKKIANEKSINLGDLTGTGPKGRILKADVEAYTPARMFLCEPTAGTATSGTMHQLKLLTDCLLLFFCNSQPRLPPLPRPPLLPPPLLLPLLLTPTSLSPTCARSLLSV